ncbi:hypothetical protein LMG31506_01310 [Cupriavidus yeoncheonensis]|uniref:DUF4148 domain-containing protein n=1 Tax=Cupriavidus yeoncheonensis TaxID=1462994 RepID=A0A916IQ01_9BURK|nr:DUF4148 domain-containing protein [Cupriavidus yeoncheonensis]CAG2134133.1 hypothetical protein LMG31506_01310 [Cupriavidus yeoncheonensis]
MNTLLKSMLAVCVLSAPVLSFAQNVQAPVTRAEVRADLVRLEQAGYYPGRSNYNYPADLQAAEARVQATLDTARHQDTGTQATTTATPSAPAASMQAAKAAPNVDQPRSAYFDGA